MTRPPLEEIAVQLDHSADLLVRLASAIERLDKRDEIVELREEVRALSNRIEAVQRYGVETRKALGIEMTGGA